MPPEQPAQPAVAQTQPILHTPASNPELQRAPAVGGESRPVSGFIQLEPSSYQAMMARLDELTQFQALAIKDAEIKETERLAALAKAGKIEEALAETNRRWEARDHEKEQRYQQLETAWLTEKKMAAIADALNGRAFVGDPVKTAGMIRKLLADEIEAARDTQGNPAVYDRTTRRPAADYLRERLENPDSDLAPLLVAKSRGGAGTDGTRTASPSQPPQPGSLEAIAARYREQASPGFGLSRVS